MNRLSAQIGIGLVLCAVGLVGCGDDDDTTPSGTGGAGAGGSGDGSGGVASGSGGTGSGGMTGMTAQPIMCGTNMCRPPTSPLGGLIGMLGGGMAGGLVPMPVACCLPDNACGLAMSASAKCEMKATPDTRCPSVNVGGLLNVAGCCTDLGQCGVDGSIVGRGCVENSQASSMLGGIIMPAARACDATTTTDDGGVTEDAGP